MQELLEAGCHFGHQIARWHPLMKQYIYAAKGGVHIFDLAKTKEQLDLAIRFLHKSTSKGKVILFLGTKKQAKEIVTQECVKAGFPFVNMRWLGGTITNFEQLKVMIDRLTDMKARKEKNEYQKYTKKEQLILDREIARLQKTLGGIESLKKLPDVLFVVDAHKELSAIKEAAMKDIPVVAICDTNADPTLVDYVIPANDDAASSVKLLVEALIGAAADGKAEYEAGLKVEEGKKKEK